MKTRTNPLKNRATGLTAAIAQAARNAAHKPKSFQADRTVGEDQWHTPWHVSKALGPFDFDPCAAPAHQRPWEIAPLTFTKEEDGLVQEWPTKGFGFYNPPYGPAVGEWLNKAAAHPGGGIALVFARTETRWCQEHVFGKASAVLFLAGRLRFCHDDGTPASAPAGAPSMLVAYGLKAVKRLQKALSRGDLTGHLMLLPKSAAMFGVANNAANDSVGVAA